MCYHIVQLYLPSWIPYIRLHLHCYKNSFRHHPLFAVSAWRLAYDQTWILYLRNHNNGYDLYTQHIEDILHPLLQDKTLQPDATSQPYNSRAQQGNGESIFLKGLDRRNYPHPTRPYRSGFCQLPTDLKPMQQPWISISYSSTSLSPRESWQLLPDLSDQHKPVFPLRIESRYSQDPCLGQASSALTLYPMLYEHSQ